MKATLKTLLRKKTYLDSVALMRFSKSLAELDGVQEAAMMMGTPANIAIMQNANLLDTANLDAASGDLIISVLGADEASVSKALQAAIHMLATPKSAAQSDQWRPRSLRCAVEQLPSARLALISVPGAFAISEARKAIRAGLHVMIFSDNVPLADEILLKQEAQTLGRLVMGPDCGTAIINGTPLAFANQVPLGNIGIVGASGTGIQELSCLVARAGEGISQALGVGGRDLHLQVGGISTLMAIDVLLDDSQTEHIILVSKPPADEVVAKILNKVAGSSMPFTFCFVGGEPPELPDNAVWARTLKGAAAHAVSSVRSVSRVPMDAVESLEPTVSSMQSATGIPMEVAENSEPAVASATPTLSAEEDCGIERAVVSASLVRGLFCGGTLCAEAQVVFRDAGVAVTSNAPIPGVTSIANHSPVHTQSCSTLLDLGADEYTQGKPHPMIEPSIRDGVLQQSVIDKQVCVVLIDIVIGFGAHRDPAGHVVSVLHELPTPWPVLIASVTGTEQDPQVRSQQVAKLVAAGIEVADSNCDGAKRALSIVQERSIRHA